MNAQPEIQSATKTNPIGAGTKNLGVNVTEAFKAQCSDAAHDARLTLSAWIREALEEKLARTAAGKDPAQLKLEGVD